MKKLLTIAAATALTSASYGASVTLTDSLTLSNSANNVINILKFDTATDIDPTADSTVGATLDSVFITVTVELANANVQVDNDNASRNTATASVTNLVNSFTVGGVTANPLTAIDLQINEQQVFNLATTTGDALGFNATSLGDYETWTPGTVSGETTGNFDGATATSLGYTTTTGQSIVFTLNSTFGTSASFSGANGFFQGNTPDGTYTVSVTYNYTPVPEVSAFSLLASFSALAFMAIRRRK